jgi:fructokinase
MYGAIEAGGTKFVCAFVHPDGSIEALQTFPTMDPESTMKKILSFFTKYKVQSIGVGMFGPVDLTLDNQTYGQVLDSPKLAWVGFNVYEYLIKMLDVPVYLTTDVNAAALGEYIFGNGKEVNTCLYLTVGTGIGGGFVKDGEPYMGKFHSEMGHIRINKRKDDSFAGSCPYHDDCLEGLASGLP